MKLILIVLALVLALLCAALAFGWFSANPEEGDLFGVLALSLASYYGSHLVP